MTRAQVRRPGGQARRFPALGGTGEGFFPRTVGSCGNELALRRVSDAITVRQARRFCRDEARAPEAQAIVEQLVMGTTAINQMSAEHRHIETVIKALGAAVSALDESRRLNADELREVVEFLRVYADRRHHQREEGLFFPLLVKLGVPPHGCPIGGLNNDHEKGRGLVSALERQIVPYERQSAEAGAALQQTLKDIIKLYQHHLWMEDAMVFPMAEKLVSGEDNRELVAKFAELDRAIGLETVERLEQFAQRLGSRPGSLVIG